MSLSVPHATHLITTLEGLERGLAWQSLEVDGHVWRWLDTGGPGPAAVLLPGSVGDGGMFVSILAAMRSRARLVAVTYPALPEPERLADGLAQVMAHLGLASAVVAGSSFAAYWAQFFALRHPQRVRAMSAITVLDCVDDPLIPATVRDRMRACYPGARHVSLATGGHYPHLVNPQAYHDLLLDVLTLA